MIYLEGVTELNNCFKKISKGLNSRELGIKRGKRFKDFTMDFVKRGSLNLKKITEATVKISEKKHNPMWVTGKLVESMRVKGIKKGSEVGYFSSDPTKESKDLTTYQVALLHHTGYRIPLQGDKGKRVRNFLAVHGIFPKLDKQFLIVPPRPFLYMSMSRYEKKPFDKKIASKFLDDLLEKV